MRGGRGLGGGGRLVRRAKVKLERAGPGFGAPPAPGLACEKIAALAGAGGGRRSSRRCPSAAWRLRPPVAPRHRAVIGPRRTLPAEEVPAESGLAPRPPKLSPPRPGISAQRSAPSDQCSEAMAFRSKGQGLDAGAQVLAYSAIRWGGRAPPALRTLGAGRHPGSVQRHGGNQGGLIHLVPAVRDHGRWQLWRPVADGKGSLCAVTESLRLILGEANGGR